MKKILLGSTALVAAGFLAGGVAHAENQPIAVTVGGYYQSAMAIIDQESDDGEFADDTNATAFGQDVEINIGGSTTLDNGLTVGFKFVIEGNESGDDSDSADERFVFFRGNFGQIRLGATESARQEFTNFAPGGSGIFGVNTPFFIFADPGNSAGIFNVRTYDDGLGSEDSMKIVYFSPDFNGFSFALSYGPSDQGQSQYGANTRNVSGQLLDHLSGAAAYSGKFGDFGVRIAGGYETYVLDKCNSGNGCEDEPDSWHAGATVSFGKVSVGGGYLHQNLIANDSTGGDRERTDFDIGIAYWDAMWGVGIQYGRADIDGSTGGVSDDVSFDLIEVDGTYILGPGVSVQAAVRFGNFEDDTVGALENEFVEFLVGSSLSF